MNKNKHIPYISVLSVISAIAVVFLHCDIYRYLAVNPSNYWFISNIIECIFYYAVPIFFMITGATLINYKDRYDSQTYFKKRLHKVIIPLIVWSIIFLLFSIYIDKIPINRDNIVVFLINTLFTRVYWFFIPLIGIYLIIPIFASIPQNNRLDLLKYLSIIIFIFSSLIPFSIGILNIDLGIRQEYYLLGSYLIYPLLGYILNEIRLSKKYRLLFYILGIISLVTMFLTTQYQYNTTGLLIERFKGYVNPPTILYSISIWIFIKELFTNHKMNYVLKIVDYLKPYTFGLYLIHYYIITLIIKIFHLNRTSIMVSLFLPFLVIPISVLILNLMKKSRYLEKIVPS